jgi:UDP-galactopyranose mutase
MARTISARHQNESGDRAETAENLLVCGRLGEYRYFDMDQAIGRAMTIAGRILQGKNRAQLLGDE